MGASSVARVGALAVFLGIGASVGVAQAGVACADDTEPSPGQTSTAKVTSHRAHAPGPHPIPSTRATKPDTANRVIAVSAKAKPAQARASRVGVRASAALDSVDTGRNPTLPMQAAAPLALLAASPRDPIEQVSFVVHQAIQVVETVARATVQSVTTFVGQLLGIPTPAVPQLTGVGNPIIPTSVDANGRVTGSPDPHITYWDGQYYATYSSWDHIEIRSAPAIALLSIATPTVVFPSGTTAPPADQSSSIWAPELHRLTDPNDGQQHWYLYYTAENPDSSFFTGHKIFVLESQGDTPLGPYASAGTLLDTKTESLTIDPTVYQAPDGRQYLFFSAYPSSSSTGTEDLYVQALANPTTTSGDPLRISSPTYGWERRGLVPGGGINEAPEVIVDGDTLNVVYSAGTYFLPRGYSLGALSVAADADLLDPQTWVDAKQPTPLLTSSPVTGVWSPGHNSFFTSPDGTQTWIAYHAYSAPLQGLPAFLSILGFDSPEYRTTRIQQAWFTADGTPVLGVPGSVNTQGSAPSGDPGLTAQFEGSPASTHAALTVLQNGPAFVAGAGVRVLLTPSGSATFTVPTPDGTYQLHLRQVPNAFGGHYSVAVNDGAPVTVDSSALSVDLGAVAAAGGSLRIALTAEDLAIADLDEIILVKTAFG